MKLRLTEGGDEKSQRVMQAMLQMKKIDTSGTFDYSSSVRIPSMNISQVLPASGSTEIALGNLQPGTLRGTCGMGMYHFQVNVQS